MCVRRTWRRRRGTDIHGGAPARAPRRRRARNRRRAAPPSRSNRRCGRLGQRRRQFLQRVLGEAAVGGDLAAEYAEQGRRRRPGRSARSRASHPARRCAVVVQRPDAGIGPHHVRRLTPLRKYWLAARRDRRSRRGGARLGGIAMIILIGRADQGEILLVGDGEEDAAVGVLEEIAALVIVELGHHDVRALHQPHFGGRRARRCPNVRRPRDRRR